eukprot:scaffold138786_cov31-Tisochrysis_lutea.AAC.4
MLAPEGRSAAPPSVPSSLFLPSSLRLGLGPMARACDPPSGAPQSPGGLPGSLQACRGSGSTAQGAGEAGAWPWPLLPLPR